MDSSSVMFLTWFHENNEMAFPNLHPIEWCMYYFTSTHTNTPDCRFWCFGRAQDLKRVTRNQNRTEFLSIVQLPAIFQRLTLLSMLEFVNEHKNYFDRLTANHKCGSRVWCDVIVDTMILWVHGKGSCKVYVQPWKWHALMVMLNIMYYRHILL